LLWSIGANTSVRLSGFYTRSDSAGLDAQIVPGATNILGQGYFGNYNVRGVSDHGVTKSGGGSITVNHDFGPVQLKSISAYNKTDGFWTFDGDQSVLNVLQIGPLDQFARMFSQEVHLLSRPDAKFQWVAGGFYFNYKAGLDPQMIRGQLFDPGIGSTCILGVSCNPNYGFDLNDYTKSTSSAIFAQGTYPIFENTNLTLGVRYTWDKEVFQGSTFAPGTNIPLPGIGGPATATAKDSAPTFRISLDHKFTRDIMAYVSFNRGLKAGGFGLGSSVQQQNTSTPFAPEKVNAVEGGFKTELFDRKVRFNLAGFYYDFKNIQLQRVTGGNAITFNGPQATIYGGEVELEAHPTANLVLNGTLGLVHSKIGNFPGAPNTCRTFATGGDDLGGFFCDPVTGAATTTPYNAKGNQLPFATPVTANLSFIYTIPSTVGKFDLSAGGYHYGGAYTEIDNRLKINPYTLINASILWTHKSDALTVRVWGKNLGNAYHYSAMNSEAGFFDIGSPAAPRQYGVTVGYKF
jgi:iron complex outermembrane receptor protein